MDGAAGGTDGTMVRGANQSGRAGNIGAAGAPLLVAAALLPTPYPRYGQVREGVHQLDAEIVEGCIGVHYIAPWLGACIPEKLA